MHVETEAKFPQRFFTSSVPRCRWNIVDLIHLVGRQAVATPIWLDIDMTWAEKLRKDYAARGHKITATSIFFKAIGIAQLKHPDTRTVLMPWGGTLTLNEIVAGFTVERYIGENPAVFLGTIREPHNKSLEQIADELRSFGEKDLQHVADLEIQHRFSGMPSWFRQFILWLGLRFPAVRLKYMGATFGVSTLGKYGIKTLLPPCITTSIFGIGAVEDRAVVRDGQVVARPMMTLSLNFDHRLIDGAPAARFLCDVKDLMEGGLEQYLNVPSADLAAAVSG